MGRTRTTNSISSPERRTHTRYPIQLALRFTVRPKGKPEVTGSGMSVDMSSVGLSLRSSLRLSSGESVLVDIDWPVPSGGGVPQHLVLCGRVVWTRGFSAGVSVWWHNYVADSNNPAQPIPPDTSKAPPALRSESRAGLILVVEASEVYVLVKAMLARYRHVVQHVSLEAALEIFRDPARSVDLLVTHSIREFASVIHSVPVIYTRFGGQPEPPTAELAGFSSIVVLGKPLRFGELRSAVHRLLPRRKATATSTNPPTTFDSPGPSS